ncbi:MAG: peptidoglycan DD-metalloendopeptidase family protein [Trueperaceae bacterium]|nr:peptidoglycan DD-metalloendopeptidase family protein [Trueperaceae bacterium]
MTPGAARPRGVRAAARAGALAAVLAALLALAGGGTAQVDTTLRDALEAQAGEYEALLEERRAEVAALEARLGATREDLQARVAERDAISARIADLAAQERALEADVAALEAEVAATEREIAEGEADLDALRTRIRALLVNLHRDRAGRGARSLATADSLHDLRVTNALLDRLSRQDVALVRDVDTRIEALETARAQLETDLADLAGARERLAATRIEQQDRRAELQAVIEDLNATQEGQEAQRVALLLAQDQLESDLASIEARLQEEIARLEAEEARLRREAAAADDARRAALEAEAEQTRERIDALTSPQEPNPAGFVGPLDGGRLVGRYGEGNQSFVALRAQEAGAAVYAVQGGVVIAAQSIGANDGFMVAVRHDPELTTVYTNLRPPPVQVGDRVQRGEVIGRLGGGTLPPPDVLRLYARVRQGGGEAFVDPLPLLGL